MPDDAGGAGPPLFGRTDALARVRALTGLLPSAAQVLVVLGAPGMGKTALLAEAARRARTAGTRVLRMTGRESETRLAFAGLHQLLQPVLASVGRLDRRRRQALDQALGLRASAENAPAGSAVSLGEALLALLADLSAHSPLLVVADDAQWIDPGSLDALAFAARRLEAEPVIMLIAARDAQVPAGFERRYAELHLPPLADQAATQLLDALPQPPRGYARRQVLEQALGNPLALTELARAVAADPDAARYWAAEPIPLADRVTASIVTRLAELPSAAREALLIAAAADNLELPGVPVEALAPAVRLGFVTANDTGALYTHPLVRSAVYHAAPFASRAAVHRRLAQALAGYPDRRAWHLASATLDTDEEVARLLEDTAAAAERRGDRAAAAATLERAAELSPELQERGRRLAAAAWLATSTGQVGWIQELADRAGAATSDPGLLHDARHAVGWTLGWTGAHEAALAILLPGATEGPSWRFRVTMLAMAATVAYTSGVPGELAAVRDALARCEDRAGSAAGADGWRQDWGSALWVKAATGPCRHAADIGAALDRITDPSALEEVPLSWSGPAAWLTDRTGLSIKLHEEYQRRIDAVQTGPRGGQMLSLGWSYVDGGRWDQALAVAAEGADIGVAAKMPVVTITCDLITGIVRAMRGDAAEARRYAGYALAGDPEQNRAVTARVRHTLGLAAMGEGDYAAAFAQLGELFTEDGQPLHFHLSYLALADVAAAAARTGAAAECQSRLETWLAHLDGPPTPRVTQLTARARGLLASPDRAEPYFAEALADPAGGEWPFERALLHLDYGEWLRRQRRINQAKQTLADAAAVLRRLRAQPWLKRAETELRACGVDVLPSGGALAELSPQQRQIVYLASLGLTNREIADRLFLSHRTVGSHLYHAYPKLGIAGRHQLRSVIESGQTVWLTRWRSGRRRRRRSRR
ncbi:MAG TPA: AAA family ATPase [Trebonia sp.]